MTIRSCLFHVFVACLIGAASLTGIGCKHSAQQVSSPEPPSSIDGLCAALDDPEPALHHRAIQILTHLGIESLDAAGRRRLARSSQSLVNVVRSDEVTADSIHLLVAIRDELEDFPRVTQNAVEALVHQLDHGDQNIRRTALLAMGHFSDHARQFRDRVEAYLRDNRTNWIDDDALCVAARLGSPFSEHSAIVARIFEEEVYEGSVPEKALATWGVEARSLVPIIERELQNSHRQDHDQLIIALRSLGHPLDSYAASLVERLGEHPGQREALAVANGWLAETLDSGVQECLYYLTGINDELVEELETHDSFFDSLKVVEAELAEWQKLAEDADEAPGARLLDGIALCGGVMPHLVRLRTYPDERRRLYARMWQMSSELKWRTSHANTLAMALRNERHQLQRAPAIKALIELGPACRDVVPELVRLLDSPQRYEREAAENVLKGLGKHAEMALPAVLSRFLDMEIPAEQLGVVHRQCDLLLTLGIASHPELADQVVRLLAEGRTQSAERLLVPMGSEAAHVVDDLVVLTEDERPPVRLAALRALNVVGQPVPDEVVARILNDKSDTIRVHAVLSPLLDASHSVQLLSLLNDEAQLYYVTSNIEEGWIPTGIETMGGLVAYRLAEFGDPDVAQTIGQHYRHNPNRVGYLVALGRFGEAAESQAPLLLEACQSSYRLGEYALPALLEVGAEKYTDEIAALLSKWPSSYCSTIIKALCQFGKQEAYLAEIVDKTVDYDTAPEAIQAIGLSGESGLVYRDILLKYLGGVTGRANPKQHAAARQAVVDLGPHVRALVSDLSSACEYEGHWLEVLATIGPNASSAAPQVLELLSEPQEVDRFCEVVNTLAALRQDTLSDTLEYIALANQNANVRTELLVLAYAASSPRGERSSFTVDLVQWLAHRPVGDEVIRTQLRELPESERATVLGYFESAWERSDPTRHQEIRRQISRRVNDIVSSTSWDVKDRAVLERWHKRLETNDESVQTIENALTDLAQRVQNQRTAMAVVAGFGGHIVFWAVLLVLYPRSPSVQALFFWNPWVRRVCGLGYVGFAVTWVPFLRRILFRPFRESLLADANLDDFDPQTFFSGVVLWNATTQEQQSMDEAFSSWRGQYVVEGASGRGKSMLTRSLVRDSKRVSVFLPAIKCQTGVLAAIQAKVHGIAADDAFLKSLVYLGALDVYIDGLNEADPQTVARICEFVQKFGHGNMIMTTQPMQWNAPRTARRLEIQPLPESSCLDFLISRYEAMELAGEGRADFVEACRHFWDTRYEMARIDLSRPAVDELLGNPMDLTTLAYLIANKIRPDLARLLEQQYENMQREYRRRSAGDEIFPLKSFSELVYAMRLADEQEIPEGDFRVALEWLEVHKLVVVRHVGTREEETRRWFFRHDKSMEFFVSQALLHDRERQYAHFGDPRFRGVYYLLANALPLNQVQELKGQLVQHAIETNDVSVLDVVLGQLDQRAA